MTGIAIEKQKEMRNHGKRLQTEMADRPLDELQSKAEGDPAFFT